MTEREKQIIQQEEQRLRDEASAHAARAMAATDEVIKRVELHQYDINQYAAVKLYHLQRLLGILPAPEEDTERNTIRPLISESGMCILNNAIECWEQRAQQNEVDGYDDEEYACRKALFALRDLKLSLIDTPEK